MSGTEEENTMEKTLPRVADLMRETLDDKVRLAHAVEALCDFTSDLIDCDIPSDTDGCAKIMVPVLETLAAKPVSETKHVLVPTSTLEDGEEADEFRLRCSAELYRLEDLHIARDVAKEAPATSVDDLMSRPADRPTLTAYSYMLSTWGEIANFLVYIPKNLSDKEVAQFVADIFWETTWSGLDEESAEERTNALADELEQSCKEIDEAIEQDRLDEVTTHHDIRAELENLIGAYECEYHDRIRDIMFPVYHNMWLDHVRTLVELADMLGV